MAMADGQKTLMRTTARNRAGFQVTAFNFMVAVMAVGLAFTLIWIGVGIHWSRQNRQVVRSADEVRAQTTAQLAYYAAEMLTLSAQVQNVQDDVRQAIGLAREQGDARVRDGSVLKSDLQRFGEWVEAGQARQERTILELQTRIEELQKQQGRDSQTWEAWRQTASVSATGDASLSPVRTPQPVAALTTETPTESVPSASATVARITLNLAGGDRYEGGLRDGLFDGAGDLHYANGNRYVGSFRLGRKQGTGTFTFANGDVYVGDFVQDQRHGRGIYTYRDKSRYEGEFRSGLRNGKGRYTYKTGGEYIGEFKDGKKSGRGTHLFPDGTTMEGYWRDDRFIGATVSESGPKK
jgi:hypothetical protein